MYGRKEGPAIISDLGMISDDFTSPHHKTFMPDVSKSISIQEDSIVGMSFYPICISNNYYNTIIIP